MSNQAEQTLSNNKAMVSHFREALTDASFGLIERESLVELIALAAIAGEHVLVLGPPGTAKSEAVRRVAQACSGQYFEYLLGRFTEPSEIFGPINLQKLREGRVEVETAGMLPEAEIAFLDEVFLGSTAILNTLLGILNERVFKRGHTHMNCPLRVCVGASNHLPEEESLAAFSDRFLVRVFVESLPDSRIEDLLEGGWQSNKTPKTVSVTMLDQLGAAAKQADVGQVRASLGHAVRLLRHAGLPLSDRRIVKSQKLVAAAAVLAGRMHPTEADLWPLIYVLPNKEAQEIAREILRPLLEKSENQTLVAAANEASFGPKTRAASIVSRFAEFMKQRPVLDESPMVQASEKEIVDTSHDKRQAVEIWKLKMEAIAREIDAGFSKEKLPEELQEIRQQIVSWSKQADAFEK